MAGFAFFVRPCPACGRKSQIALDYLGKQVRCKHCSRVFTAEDAHAQSATLNDPVSFWIHFTENEFDGQLPLNVESRRLPR